MEFHHITSDQNILSGKPCIMGTRISVDMILEWMASGASIADVVNKYPALSEDAVKEALLYASRIFHNEIIIQTKNVA